MSLLDAHESLYNAAAALPGARPISGRGTAYAVPIAGERWLVRHYRRGGAVAALLEDRYATLEGNRALAELRVSCEARERGIATPAVVAAVEYPHGWFSRFDIAVDFIPNSRDFGEHLSDNEVHPVLERIVGLIRTMVRAGLVHRDFNVKNIIIAPDKAYVVDLDRASLNAGYDRYHARRMRDRLLRSIRKFERTSGASLANTERRALIEAFDV